MLGATWHEENLIMWEGDKYIDYSVPNFTKIPLYPDPDRVYIWGHSFDAVSYSWKTASEDGKVFAMPEETIAFDKFGEKKELGSFFGGRFIGNFWEVKHSSYFTSSLFAQKI